MNRSIYEVIQGCRQSLLPFVGRIPGSSASTRPPMVVAATDQGFDRDQVMGEDDALPNAGEARRIAATLAEAINPLLGGARRE